MVHETLCDLELMSFLESLLTKIAPMLEVIMKTCVEWPAMVRSSRTVAAIFCSFWIYAQGSTNIAFNPSYDELDGNRTTCWENTSYSSVSFTLGISEVHVISRINIEFKYNKTDALSGFYLFVAHNCSQDWKVVTPAYRHTGPVLGSYRVTVTFPADAPQNGGCVRLYINRTSTYLPAGYSNKATMDICNLEVLGCRVGRYGTNCTQYCPASCSSACNPDNGKCLNDVTVMEQEYQEVLCPDPGFLQDSLSIICAGDPPVQPVVSALSYGSTVESCPQRHAYLRPCEPEGYPNNLNSLCYNNDVCTVDSQDVFLANSTECTGGNVLVLQLQYRCTKVCPIKENELNVPFATLQEAHQSGALVLHYECYPGYSSPVLNVLCDPDALVWLGEFPNCRRNCSVTDIRKNVSNAYWWNNETHLLYTCNAGYTLHSGDLMHTCSDIGTWSGILPNCRESTCPCLCGTSSESPTFNVSKALEDRIEEIKSLLAVDRRTTSKFNRSRESIIDHRLSAQGIGYDVGVTVLVIICGLICIPDIPKLVQDIRCGCS